MTTPIQSLSKIPITAVGQAYVIDNIHTISYHTVEEILVTLPLWRQHECALIRHPQRRKESILAFHLLQSLLHSYGIVDDLAFDYLPHGKPILRNHKHIHFNLSHCATAVACIIDSTPVGIDIERKGRYNLAIAKKVCNDNELSTLLHSDNVDTAFTTLWTRKEAASKLLGTGLTCNIKDILAQHSNITIHSFNLTSCILSTAHNTEFPPR